jgi:FkbM family methyltransferase
MNPIWLVRNIVKHWPTRGSGLDFVRTLRWIYSAKLPEGLRSREQVISFSYPLPVGRIRLLVRSNAGSDSFIHGEVFDHEYYRLPLPKPPTTILDLGANTGMTAVYFGRVYPQARLACVEPIPDNLRVLTRNLALNSIRAEVLPAAVDVKDGQVVMQLEPMDYGHKVAASGANPLNETVEVEAVSIPTILRRLGWERIGLLKVDIEGHEKVLLSTGCEWLGLVDAMCIECHDGFGERDLQRLSERFGFLPPERLAGIWLTTRKPEGRIC